MLSDSKPREYDEDTAIGKLEAYLPNIPDTCCIVFFVRGKADGKKRFKKLLQKYAGSEIAGGYRITMKIH